MKCRWSLHALVLFGMALSHTALAVAQTPNSVCPMTPGELCSKTFMAEGRCNGKDQVPILEMPWEPRPISIVGVTVGLRLQGQRWFDRFLLRPVSSYIFAGNSFAPDLMALLIGGGSTTVMYPVSLSFAFPAKASNPADTAPHIDAHVSCSGAINFEAWLVVFYFPR